MDQEHDQSDALVSDIDPAARRWIEQVVGRPLAEDERVYLMAYRPDKQAGKSGSHQARERLLQLFDQAAANIKRLGVSDNEVEAAIGEAIDHARDRQSPRDS